MRRNLLSSTIKIFREFSEARRREIGGRRENLNAKSLNAMNEDRKEKEKGAAPPAPSQD
jgi:hypothetical protein